LKPLKSLKNIFSEIGLIKDRSLKIISFRLCKLLF
jgi:hypothetical protein